MSILIKGLKMPKGDKALVVCINSNGTVDRPNWQWDYTLIKGAEAISIPDHGDLIDRDVLMAHKGSAYDIDGHELYAVGTGTILRMPVVIPAERSEE